MLHARSHIGSSALCCIGACQMIELDSLRALLDLVRRNGRRAEYLDLVAGACSHRGEGVSSKQELVCDLVFGDGDGVFEAEEEQSAFVSNDAAREAAREAGAAAAAGDPSLGFAAPEVAMRLETAPGLSSVDILLPTRNTASGSGTVVFCAPLPAYADFCRQRGVDLRGRPLREARAKGRPTRLYGRAMSVQELRSEYLVYARTMVRHAPKSAWKDMIDLMSTARTPALPAAPDVLPHRAPSTTAVYVATWGASGRQRCGGRG